MEKSNIHEKNIFSFEETEAGDPITDSTHIDLLETTHGLDNFAENHAMDYSKSGRTFGDDTLDKFVDSCDLDDDSDMNDKPIYIGEKDDFSCDKCDYTSNCKRSLNKHVKTIHKNACEECDYTASDNKHLKTHVKLSHQKDEI